MPGAAAERGLGCAGAKAKGPAGSRWGRQRTGVGGGRGQVSGRDQVGRQGQVGEGRGQVGVWSVEVFPKATPDTALEKGTDVSGEASFSFLHPCTQQFYRWRKVNAFLLPSKLVSGSDFQKQWCIRFLLLCNKLPRT